MGSKSERTREAIRDAAVVSFRDNGYDATTIRSLASELGIAVGSAYYHFPSKSHLVQELYVDVANAHHDSATRALAAESKLAARIRTALLLNLDLLEPFGDHASEFLVAAMRPGDDANPLSPASSAAHETFMRTFAAVVNGASDHLPGDIATLLPAVLYRVNLLVSLAWVQDVSPGHARTRALVTKATSLVGLALPALRIPPVRTSVRNVLSDVALIGEA